MPVEKLRLKDNHTWKSKPGYSICVLERGLVRFDYPRQWIVEPAEGAVMLHDRKASVESCDLGVSIFPLPEDVIREVVLDELLLNSLQKERKNLHQSPIHHIQRPDLEVSWIEQRYTDAEYNRDARFRVALARGPVICLISMNYWDNRAPGLERVWDEILRTLTMGLHVEDPAKGPVVH